MRQPGPPLALVDAERLQTRLQVVGERRARARLVVEDEHADAPGLAVARTARARTGSAPAAAPRSASTIGVELAAGPAAEERERDVQVLAAATTADAAPSALALPARRAASSDVVGQPEREEEAEPLIAARR